MSEDTHNLPIGWSIAGLPQVADINPTNPEHVPCDGQDVSFIPMSAAEAITGRIDTSERRKWGQVKKGYTRFQEGDVLFAKITPCMENGKVVLARGLHGSVGAGSTEFHVLRVNGPMPNTFLMHYLLQDGFRKEARANMTGTAGQLRVPKKFLENHSLPIPPLPEQHRIVEAIESYLTRLDDAVASLERVQRNLERYRASVLKAAVEGRLVPTEAELARKEGRDYEPADVLLERILKERRRRWIEDAAEKGRAKAEEKAKKAGKPWTDDDNAKTLEKERAKAAKKYKEPAPPDTTNLPVLPEGWCWTTVEQLGNAVTGTTPSTSKTEYYGGDLPFFKPTDLEAGTSVISARQYLTSAGADQSRVLPPETVLVTCIGATIGKTGLAKVRCATNQQINALVAEDAIRDTRYLYWFFVSPAGQAAVIDNASSTTLPILNKGRFERLPVPLPPRHEQTRIVEKVERLLSVSEGVDKELKNQERRCQRLRQSILKWAFEGKLVDQDPNDEPASVLLKRIKAERDAAKPKKKVARRGGKNADE